MVNSQWDQMLIPRILVNVFIYSYDMHIRDTLKNITNSGRNLFRNHAWVQKASDICGKCKQGTYIFKKPTHSVSNHFVNTCYVPGPMLDTGDVEMKGCNLCPEGLLHWLGRQGCTYNLHELYDRGRNWAQEQRKEWVAVTVSGELYHTEANALHLQMRYNGNMRSN